MQAFSKLPITYVEYLFSHSSTALSEVLAYQIFPFVLTLNSVGNGSNYATIEGQNVTATVVGNSTFFNNAQVTIANNIESNGIAHEINAVLLPVATSTVAPTASPTPTPTITFDWDRSSRRAGSRRHL